MKIQTLRDRIDEICTHVLFDYNGKECGVDPFSHHHFEMWYGDVYAEAKSIDEVFSLPIFDGKSLTDVFDKIENIEL